RALADAYARAGSWESADLWLRRSFELSAEALGALQGGDLYLRLHHDEDAEVYLNGVRIATLKGYTTGYRLEPMGPESIRLLEVGLNVLAVHVSQSRGGQFFDAGIVEWVPGME
ncbi:MAG: hypothetical protein ACWGSQ_07810, partial [Longimicrobiales bacterium]